MPFIRINFTTSGNGSASADWNKNDVTAVGTGTIIADCLDENGATTGIAFATPTAFNAVGFDAGNNAAGSYPGDIFDGWMQASAQRTLRFTGFPANQSVTFRAGGNRNVGGVEARDAQFTINSTSQTYDNQSNATPVAPIAITETADGSGQLDILVDVVSVAAYVNFVELEWSTTPPRSITDIDGDNAVQAGQPGVVITAEGLDNPSITQTATLGGIPLTLLNWISSSNEFPFDSNRVIAASPKFVSPTGSDANNGSIGSPWATINYAVQQLVAGDTLYLRGGTHVVTDHNMKFSHNNGSAGNLIEITSYPGEFPVIDCSGARWLRLQNRNYWRFSHLKLINYTIGWEVGEDVTADNCEWYSIEGRTALGGDNVGLIKMREASNFNVDRVRVTLTVDPATVHQNTGGLYHVDINGSMSGTYNRIEAYNFQNGIYFKHGLDAIASHTGAITVSNSFFYGNIRNTAGYNPAGVKFDNCIFQTNTNLAEDDGGKAGDWNWFDHCTFYSTLNLRDQLSGAQNNKVTNSIVTTLDINGTSSVTSDSNYNLFVNNIEDGITSRDLASWQTANSSDANSLQGTPTYVGSDFSKIASYALNSGSIGENASSTSTDIGADVTAVGVSADGVVVPTYTYANRTKLVTTSASGGGDGSEGNPWTLAEAMTNAVAGDIVGIDEGVYVGSGVESRVNPAFAPTNSGTSENPIVFVAKNPAAKNSTNLTELRSGATTQGTGWPIFGGNGPNHIYWIGIKADNTQANSKIDSDCGACTLWNNVGTKVLLCEFVGEASISDNYAGVRLELCNDIEIADNKITGYSDDVNSTGITVYKTNNFKIHHNEFDNCFSAVHIKSSTDATTDTIYDFEIYQNLIHDSHMAFRFLGPVKGASGELNLVYQNICFNLNFGVENTSSATHVGEQDGLRVFNNVFYNVVNGIWRIQHDYTTSGTVPRDNNYFNNIQRTIGSYLNTGVVAYSNVTHHRDFSTYERNCISNATSFGDGTSASALDSLTFNDWQTTYSEDANSITSDPLFTNEVAQDFTLQGGSPCISLGRDRLGKFGAVDSVIDAGVYVNGNEIVGIR